MLIAKIREEECVGCAKCLPACPVDAILGAHKFLHTVLVDECIGCGLCLAPCPMDCIDMIESGIADGSEEKKERAALAKRRYQAKQQRHLKETPLKLQDYINPLQKTKIRTEIQESFTRWEAKRHESKEMQGNIQTVSK